LRHHGSAGIGKYLLQTRNSFGEEGGVYRMKSIVWKINVRSYIMKKGNAMTL